MKTFTNKQKSKKYLWLPGNMNHTVAHHFSKNSTSEYLQLQLQHFEKTMELGRWMEDGWSSSLPEGHGKNACLEAKTYPARFSNSQEILTWTSKLSVTTYRPMMWRQNHYSYIVQQLIFYVFMNTSQAPVLQQLRATGLIQKLDSWAHVKSDKNASPRSWINSWPWVYVSQRQKELQKIKR